MLLEVELFIWVVVVEGVVFRVCLFIRLFVRSTYNY